MRRLVDKIPERHILLQHLARAHALANIKGEEQATSLVGIDVDKNRQIPLRKGKDVPLPFPGHLGRSMSHNLALLLAFY